jgi:DNA-binding PadR family transcriptional regulator
MEHDLNTQPLEEPTTNGPRRLQADVLLILSREEKELLAAIAVIETYTPPSGDTPYPDELDRLKKLELVQPEFDYTWTRRGMRRNKTPVYRLSERGKQWLEWCEPCDPEDDEEGGQ